MSAFSPVPMRTCERCGAERPADAKFCSNCGAPVSSNTEFAPPARSTYWGDTETAPPPMPATYAPYSGMLETGGGIGKLWSAGGRIGRMEYFLTLLGIWVALIVAWGIVIAVDAVLLTVVLGFGTWLIAIVVAICAGVKRLHDFDQTGWLYLLMLVPIASFILLLLLLLKGGSFGANQYGVENSGSLKG